jgi:hypothetical protein
VITDWGSGMLNADKVPSVISYSRPSEAMEQQWGSNLSENAVSMVHTKLELGVQDVLGELDMTLQVLDGMKNLYLTKIFKRFYEAVEDSVEDFTAAFKRNTATDLVVTVPTVWEKTWRLV